MHVFDQVVAVLKIENRIQERNFIVGPPPDIHLPFTSAVMLHGPRTSWIIGWNPLLKIIEVLGIMVFDPQLETTNSIGKEIIAEFAAVNEFACSPTN
jgi:hypothetical protein